MSALDEFEIIARLFAPLARHTAARGLIDDAAVLEIKGELVVTTDAVVEGVHFRAEDAIGDIAKKALRVNLSDLAGKGAKPIGALLTLIWPNHRPSAQIADFAHGLAEDLARYDVALLGGDTSATPGPLCVSITAFGAPLGERVPSRADAKPGDDLWVTGTLGDAWLGYQALAGAWPEAAEPHRAHVVQRYRLPAPRVAFAEIVARCANASIDVSDGLAADAAKLAAASRLALRIEANLAPLSQAAQAWRRLHGGYGRLLDWGDDYEILFSADPTQRETIAAAGERLGVAVKRIGAVEAGAGVHICDSDGASLAVAGHVHKLGA